MQRKIGSSFKIAFDASDVSDVFNWKSKDYKTAASLSSSLLNFVVGYMLWL